MSRTKIDLNTVRRIARALPGLEESTAYGSFALKLRGKLVACVPTHKSAEPDSLMIRVDFEQRAELLKEAPRTYSLKISTRTIRPCSCVWVKFSRMPCGICFAAHASLSMLRPRRPHKDAGRDSRQTGSETTARRKLLSRIRPGAHAPEENRPA